MCRDTLISAYKSLVQTYIDYCCEVWDPIDNISSNTLQSLARIMMGYRKEHGQSNAAMAELWWKTLKERRLQSKAGLMYKITHGMAPTVLKGLF